MKLTSGQRSWILTSSVSALAVLGLLSFVFMTGPSLRLARTTLDNDRAIERLLELQQSNRQQLIQQQRELEETKKSLEPLVWTFAREEEFFQFLEQQAGTHHLELDDPQIADVTPVAQPLSRVGTIVLHGSADNILGLLNDLQSHQPLISLQQLDLQPGQANGTLRATLEIETIWQ